MGKSYISLRSSPPHHYYGQNRQCSRWLGTVTLLFFYFDLARRRSAHIVVSGLSFPSSMKRKYGPIGRGSSAAPAFSPAYFACVSVMHEPVHGGHMNASDEQEQKLLWRPSLLYRCTLACPNRGDIFRSSASFGNYFTSSSDGRREALLPVRAAVTLSTPIPSGTEANGGT